MPSSNVNSSKDTPHHYHRSSESRASASTHHSSSAELITLLSQTSGGARVSPTTQAPAPKAISSAALWHNSGGLTPWSKLLHCGAESPSLFPPHPISPRVPTLQITHSSSPHYLLPLTIAPSRKYSHPRSYHYSALGQCSSCLLLLGCLPEPHSQSSEPLTHVCDFPKSGAVYLTSLLYLL